MKKNNPPYLIKMGNSGSSGGGNHCDHYEGHGGTACTKQDIMTATTAGNSLNDASYGSWGNQVSGARVSRVANPNCHANGIKYNGRKCYHQTSKGNDYDASRNSSRDWK